MTMPEPLTADEVRALREVAEAATPGYWFAAEGTRSDTHGVIVEDSLGDWVGTVAKDATESDANFIATANPETVLRLLAAPEQHAALVARVGALADEWEALAGDSAWAGQYRMTWTSCAGQVRAALGGIDDGEGSR